MNLVQQETKDFADDLSDKKMDYDNFLEILDQSANNITPRDAPPRLKTPISSGVKKSEASLKNNN